MQEHELDLIREEFKTAKDLQLFILKYFSIQHAEVQYLVAQAQWRQTQQESEPVKFDRSIQNFIYKYKKHTQAVIRIMVLNAMYVQLKKNQNHWMHIQLNDAHNEMIEYARTLDQQDDTVCRAIIYAYWFKADSLKHKDQFKAQHFLQKIKTFEQHLQLDDESRQYIFQAEITLILMRIEKYQAQFSAEVFYRILNQFNVNQDASIHIQLKNLVGVYIYQKIDLARPIKNYSEIEYFLDYLDQHTALNTMLLQLDEPEVEQLVLIRIAFLFWLLGKSQQSMAYIMAYFHYLPSAIDLICLVKQRYYFTSPEAQQDFIELIQQGFEKYKNLNKYRQLFKSHKEREENDLE
ncbi:hypothetical protein [Acinetobacter populi]|uniref:DUF4034 domain-containing protein n=1 Tax=Acinetobacter populi TaxID=1582270 RepID=A0A1Z9YUW4_9GAMM|nr:hypothetical protein [Acinetobacter populi]OUY05995.1 hypothetical protein CAP51_14885 [Acinetobacter populi]